MPWIAVYDDGYLGQSYSTASGLTTLKFPYVDWSDTAIEGGYFSYDAVSGAVFGKTYAYIPQIEVDGLYAITLTVQSEDMNATKDYKVKTGLNVDDADYPGRKAADPILWTGASTLNQDFSTGYFYYAWSWVLPLKVSGSPPEQINPVWLIQLATTEVGNKSWTLRNRMWIARLSGDDYADASFPASNDPGPYGT